MARIDITIPQMGEGLQEVVIVGFQKQPGDTVRKDEILYSMETDKAVMEVESPYAGVLVAWLASEGDILPIGAPLAQMEVEAEVPLAVTELPISTPAIAPPSPSPNKEVVIPPRTRAHARECRISEEELRSIPTVTGKLMPSDVDAYLTTRAASPTPPSLRTPTPYTDRSLSQEQRVFIHHLRRSSQTVIPAVIKRPVVWSGVRQVAEAVRAQGGTVQPSSFQTFAYCVAQATVSHPKFRSTLLEEKTAREYAHVNLGIAVGNAAGELHTAMVPNADTLDFLSFVQTLQEQIEKARAGEDQATAATQLLLTYMGPYEVVDAIPVLVAPAVGVLFIGSTFEQNSELLANLVLTFDHRLIQGIEAAEFLRTIVEKVRQVADSGLVTIDTL